MAQRRLTDRRALVTGASSGIGRALAIELARQGVDLILLARREDRLAEVVQQVAQHRAPCNCRRRRRHRSGRTPTCASKPLKRELGGLDILVNNAGIAAHGRFAEADPARLRPIMEVNFFAPVELIRESLPLLRAGRQPIVVNVGSILGRRGCPHKSEYSASKFALHGFSEAVRPELARLGIDVLVVAAGPTETEHFDVLIEDKGELPWGDPRRKPAAEVAREIVHAIQRGKHEVIPSWRGRLWLMLNRLSPRIVDRIMNRYG